MTASAEALSGPVVQAQAAPTTEKRAHHRTRRSFIFSVGFILAASIIGNLIFGVVTYGLDESIHALVKTTKGLAQKVKTLETNQATALGDHTQTLGKILAVGTEVKNAQIKDHNDSTNLLKVIEANTKAGAVIVVKFNGDVAVLTAQGSKAEGELAAICAAVRCSAAKPSK